MMTDACSTADNLTSSLDIVFRVVRGIDRNVVPHLAFRIQLCAVRGQISSGQPYTVYGTCIQYKLTCTSCTDVRCTCTCTMYDNVKVKVQVNMLHATCIYIMNDIHVCAHEVQLLVVLIIFICLHLYFTQVELQDV